MTPPNPKKHSTPDIVSTMAGGGAGIGVLMTVRWEAVPYGELVKIGVALFLIVVGAMLYRPVNPPAPDADDDKNYTLPI